MQIETKFDVGQNVYTIINGVAQVKIKKIKIDIEKEINIAYILDVGLWFYEKDLFATKEEAEEKIKKLVNKNEI